ncbi:uncharacterized protein LOC121169730 [Ochotona curzoniae]|uniref:uncharacterized protein LOC121169730 n=1 Tax=Ochotona curzoniae TaxID=130825 RepID=UPI001B34808B|nr:uncharacterized protein LOC121169730 [Ochotona curzoniae]
MRSPSSEKKAQHWDEMNIRATYHPADKDYGFMKVDEPSTPYRREDSDENLAAGSSPKVTPDMLEQRFATMDNLLPKVLQYGDNRSPGPADDVSKPYSKDFAQQRKMHYSEGKALKPQKNLPLEDNMAGQGPSANVSSSGHQVTLSPEPLPLQRSEAAEQASIGVKGYSTCGNRSVPASGPVTMEQGMGPRRKEYFSQRRYLRSDFHPELDMEDEQQDSSTGMIRQRESPLSTEVRLLDSTSSSLSDRQPEDSLTMMVISSQSGITTSSQERRSQVPDWVQWPGAQELSPQSPGSSKKERGSHLDPSSHRRHKYETARIHWTQKEEI